MDSKRIKDLLEAEMASSTEFSKQNFGLKYGDDFREIAMELNGSDHINMTMVMNAVLSSLNGDAFAKEVTGLAGAGHTQAMRQSLRNNPGFIEGYLAFFYWGLKIGQRLAEQERQVLDAILSEANKASTS